MTQNWLVLKVVKIHQYPKFQAIPSMCSPGNTRKPKIWSVSLSQNCAKIRTRQHSTQSVGNMPPPSPRHLLPQVLQIMPRNPKYDQFQPKGHHNEENPQSRTKMPGNPKFYLFHLVKIASKLEKSTNCSHNLISSERLKVVRIHQHAKFQAISSMGFPENAWKPRIWPVSLSQNSTKIRKITRPLR